MLTLRQIEVIRAVMLAGTLAGAARMLGVSAPGVSRLMKYTERTLKVKLFERIQNRYVPSREAEDIFEQINGVYKKVDDLQYVLQQVDRGAGILFKIASVPSLSHFVVPNALKRLREKFPALGLDLDIIKVQEVQDYLLLGKCELAVLSYSIAHPGLELQSLGRGTLRCVVPLGHPLSGSPVVSVADIARYPIVGVVPDDPYGRIMLDPFQRAGVPYELAMSVRFGVTTIGLVRAGIGVAVIDQFAAPDASQLGVKVLRIREPTSFEAFVAMRAHRPLSRHGEACLQLLRDEIRRETAGRSP
jgi:DNA-binding transcriptional LysR family regulator